MAFQRIGVPGIILAIASGILVTGCGGGTEDVEIGQARKVAEQFCRYYVEGPRRRLERLVSSDYINESNDLSNWIAQDKRVPEVSFQDVAWGFVEMGPSSAVMNGRIAIVRSGGSATSTTVHRIRVVVGITPDGYRVIHHELAERPLLRVRGRRSVRQALEADADLIVEP